MEISGRKIVITGGAGGMGRQFAIDLLKLGAKPFVIDVASEELEALKAETGIDGAVVEVADEGAVVSFFERYADENGAPDILINNAGVTADGFLARQGRDGMKTMPLSDWRRVIDVNLTGVFLCGREAAARMIHHGVKGLILNISSLSKAGNMGQSNYSAAKAGVAAMTVTWAKELARYGIRSAAIAPGFVNTGMIAKINPKILDAVVADILVGRFGEPEEISRAVRFIIECDYFNGRVLEVDGGHRL